MKRPCTQDCAERSPTCHSECQRYLDFYAENRKRDNENIKKKDVDYYQAEERRKNKIAYFYRKGKFNYRSK